VRAAFFVRVERSNFGTLVEPERLARIPIRGGGAVREWVNRRQALPLCGTDEQNHNERWRIPRGIEPRVPGKIESPICDFVESSTKSQSQTQDSGHFCFLELLGIAGSARSILKMWRQSTTLTSAGVSVTLKLGLASRFAPSCSIAALQHENLVIPEDGIAMERLGSNS
jgi:hypothetical protein